MSNVEKKQGQEVCGPLDSGKIDTSGDPSSVTVTAPEGFLISGYCVKAGSSQSTETPVVYVTVDPAGSVTFGHPSGKAVSHYSYSLVEVEVEVPTTTVPEVPVTTVPEVPVTTVPEVPVTTVPEVPTTTVPCGAVCGPATVDPPSDPLPDDCLGTTTRWTLQPCGEVIEIDVGVVVPDEPDVLETTTTVAVPVDPPMLPETGAETTTVIGAIGLFLVAVGAWLKWVTS